MQSSSPRALGDFKARGVEVDAVGKICEIYSGRAIASSVRVADECRSMEEIVNVSASDAKDRAGGLGA
ncbi:MAG: hypothetical protein ABI231_08995 [Candidatus Tumulicola sp.]